MSAAATVGVVGAGQMGSGIAQAGVLSGARVVLFDADPAGLERGCDRIRTGIERLAAKGALDGAGAAACLGRLSATSEVADLAPCDLVVEAVPEALELKREVMAGIASVVAEECVLATNTSSLSVSEIALGLPAPERVVGLHFFNPVHAMQLVELVAGARSAPQALVVARATAEAMGKDVIAAADVPGFIVNRVNRSFFLEALRIVEEGMASPEAVDRVMRLGAGFPMGPFELMDLVGIDTNHAIAEVFHRQSYGEPRFRPSPLAAAKVSAGELGRKSGRGWYDYADGSDGPARDAAPPASADGEGRVVVVADEDGQLDELARALEERGWTTRSGAVPAEDVHLTIACDGAALGAGAGPCAMLLRDGSLHAKAPRAVGFCWAGPLAQTRLVEVTRTDVSDPEALRRLEEVLASIGLATALVQDGPGLVSARIVAMLINEACFLIGSGNATSADVDLGMRLGVRHPRGPFEWCAELGPEVVAGTLRALLDELGDPRYRMAPDLQRRAAVAAVGGRLVVA